MRDREIIKGAPPADLLVCFPSRAHLNLMPKPICSPGRVSSGTDKRRHRRHHSHHHLLLSHNRTKQLQQQQQQSNNQLVKKQSLKRGQPSPILWVKSKQMSSVISEPTSPKVTCAGQIKVKSKSSKKPCKNWQSVMEEIERIHSKNTGQNKKRSGWAGSLGFHKDVVHFLTCLRNLKFNFGCFGSFPVTEITTTDDEDEDEEDQNNNKNNNGHRFDNVDKDKNSKTTFSKWLMVLQDNNSNSTGKCKVNRRGSSFDEAYFCESYNSTVPPAPPPNALLLMRCRSAPAKSWSVDEFHETDEGTIEDGNEKKGFEEKVVEGESKKLRVLMDEEKRVEDEERKNDKIENNMVLMRYDTEYYKISNDISKETWIVGDFKDSLWRSRSCKS